VIAEKPELFWGIVASMWIGNLMLLVLNLPLVGLWVRLLTIRRPYLHAGILVLASVGAYSVNRSVFDIGLLYAIGVAGYLMRRWHIPLAPAVIGTILGPMAEQHLRRALAAAEGSWTVFVRHPISAVILLVAVAVAVVPRVLAGRGGGVPSG